MNKNVVSLPNREQLRDQAAVWLVRLQDGLSVDQERDLGEWLEQNPSHRAMLIELATLWDELAILNELSELFPFAHKVPVRSRNRLMTRLSIAASIVLAISIGIWLGVEYFDSAKPPMTAANSKNVSLTNTQYSTAIGEQSTINLPDGSAILLNTNTQLSVQYTDTERKIKLIRGEGHFKVAKDPSRPFVVTAGTHAVRAVGTAFSVTTSDSEGLKVLVTEGSVAVFSSLHSIKDWGLATPPPREETTVTAGEMVTIQNSSSHVERLDEDNIAKQLAWRNGMVVFEDESLDTVIKELGRYTTTKLTLADNSLSEIRVAGYFRTGDLEALLFALRENFQIESRNQGTDTIVLFRQ
jgi:transmembrane sensor